MLFKAVVSPRKMFTGSSPAHRRLAGLRGVAPAEKHLCGTVGHLGCSDLGGLPNASPVLLT